MSTLWWALGWLGRELALWYRAFLCAIPGEIGCLIRRHLFGFRAGPSTRVLAHVTIYYPERLTIGARCTVTVDCQLNAAGGITIGDDVLIGPGSKVWSQNHRYADPDVPVNQQGYDFAPVTIERGAWLAAGVIVLPGVTIGEGTVVAAGAVVSRSTEPYSVVAGIPARTIGSRRPETAVV